VFGCLGLILSSGWTLKPNSQSRIQWEEAMGAFAPPPDGHMLFFINNCLLTGRQFTTNNLTRCILWRLKSTEIRFRPRLYPGHRWGSWRRSPDSGRFRRETPFLTPPFTTSAFRPRRFRRLEPHSALNPRTPKPCLLDPPLLTNLHLLSNELFVYRWTFLLVDTLA